MVVFFILSAVVCILCGFVMYKAVTNKCRDINNIDEADHELIEEALACEQED